MKGFKGEVVVVGATGRTGQWIVKRLGHYNVSFRLFVRSGEKALELFGPEIIDKLKIGSVEHEPEVLEALAWSDAVICALGSNVQDPLAAPPSTIDRDGVIRLARLAKQAGVRKFILVSSLAVTKPDHPLNKYGKVLTMKLEGEDGVRAIFSDSGMSYTILRPGGLLDGPPLLHALQFDTGDRITGSIDRSDVAEAAVLSLWLPKAHNRTFELIRTTEAPQESLEPCFERL